MAWSERQLALLRAMGVPAWLPEQADSPQPAESPSLAYPKGSPAAVVSEPIAIPATPVVPTWHGPSPAAPVPPVPPVPHATPILAAPAGASLPSTPPAVDLGRAAGLGWDDLRAAVAACQACSLCQTRRQTVFGVGHPQSHWMVVGEAPGEHEDQQGEPFVGAAGQLLDRMLAALGLSRAPGEGGAVPARQVYIANTLKCRPPRNRNPEPSELAQCEPFLIRQIELLRPKVILAMGRFAVQALLRSDEAIGRLRGRVHRYQGVPLIVTYHPAYLLRNPADKAKAWDDLCLAAATMAAQPLAHG